MKAIYINPRIQNDNIDSKKYITETIINEVNESK